MTTSQTYDREWCEQFVESAIHTLTPEQFVMLWYAMAFPTTTTTTTALERGTGARFYAEWHGACAWTKQGILFSMRPHLERIIADVAMAAASAARQLEPL
jgi:hypothetical protein